MRKKSERRVFIIDAADVLKTIHNDMIRFGKAQRKENRWIRDDDVNERTSLRDQYRVSISSTVYKIYYIT